MKERRKRKSKVGSKPKKVGEAVEGGENSVCRGPRKTIKGLYPRQEGGKRQVVALLWKEKINEKRGGRKTLNKGNGLESQSRNGWRKKKTIAELVHSAW